jgi:hypothetical protein
MTRNRDGATFQLPGKGMRDVLRDEAKPEADVTFGAGGVVVFTGTL